MIIAYNYSCLSEPRTVCPRSLDPFHVVSYYIELVKTSWTDIKKNDFKFVKTVYD